MPGDERDWWRRAFEAGVYPLRELTGSPAFRSRTRFEVPFLVRTLGLSKGSTFLDVCCGVGRHALPLAGRGCAVTGVDISARYLREARRAARKEGLRAEFVRRDMRDLGFSDRFDAAASVFTSFGYFPTVEEDLKSLRSVRRALKPGGLFLLDVINGTRTERIMRWQERMGAPALRWAELEDGTVVLEEAEFLARSRIVRNHWTILGGKRREMVSRIRIYGRRDLTRLLRRAGFRTLRVFGEMAPVPYLPLASKRLVVLASRPRNRDRGRRD
ncbi:class I SAM-dependent methyltransferase [Elusimicrobiota bacterium]